MLYVIAHLHIIVDRYKCDYNNSMGSDFKSGVRIALTIDSKKIADRWTVFLSLWAADPMVGSLIGYAEYCGDPNELCHGFRRSLGPNIHIIKYGAQV